MNASGRDHLFAWLLAAPAAVLFLIAGGSKALFPQATLDVLATAQIPSGIAGVVIWVIPPIEIGIGLCLLARRWSPALSCVAFGLLGVFSGFLLWLIALDQHASCACFGAFLERIFLMGPEGSLVRNSVLVLFLSVSVVLSRRTLPRLQPVKRLS